MRGVLTFRASNEIRAKIFRDAEIHNSDTSEIIRGILEKYYSTIDSLMDQNLKLQKIIDENAKTIERMNSINIARMEENEKAKKEEQRNKITTIANNIYLKVKNMESKERESTIQEEIKLLDTACRQEVKKKVNQYLRLSDGD